MVKVDAEEDARRKAELDRFKREIDLVRFIVDQSDYHVRQNSGLYARLWRADKDELVVTRKSDGVWVWCDPRNVVPRSSTGPRGDQGTIIDFVRRKLSGPQNMGELRKELRRWTGSYAPSASPQRAPAAPSLQPTKEPDRELVARSLAESPPTTNSRYLSARGLRPETLRDPRFAGQIHGCSWGEARFPHRDRLGITGFERKSPTFSGFATGGTRGLWCSKALPSDTRLVVSEASIECLSFHQLHPHPGTRYISTGGTISFSQADLLARRLRENARGQLPHHRYKQRPSPAHWQAPTGAADGDHHSGHRQRSESKPSHGTPSAPDRQGLERHPERG